MGEWRWSGVVRLSLLPSSQNPMVKIQIKWGRYTIISEGQSDMEAIVAISLWGELPSACPKCNTTDLSIHHRAVDTYNYFNVQCRACMIELKLGQRKDGSGLFPHKEWTEIRLGQQQGDGQDYQQTAPPRQPAQAPRQQYRQPAPQPPQRPPQQGYPQQPRTFQQPRPPQQTYRQPPPQQTYVPDPDYDPDQDPGQGQEPP